MFPRASALCAAVALSFLSSCAAMFTGSKSEVMFTSEPTGAHVTAGKASGVTPCSLKFDKSVKEAVFAREGQEPRTVSMDRTFQGGFLFMDILFTPGFGLSGIFIDSVSSAYFKHPPLVHCDLTKPAPVETEASEAKPAVAYHTDD